MGDMIFEIFAKDKDIMKIDHNKYTNIGMKDKCMTRMKVLGASDKPIGMTNLSYKPNLVLKAVFHSSPSWMRI